jgi:hypothetical protein
MSQQQAATDVVPELRVDFAGEVHRLDGRSAFCLGREADLTVDENPYLHRRFLELRPEHGLWWLVNVGGQLAATVSDSGSGVHAWLAPGGRMPLVFARTVVRFTAGPTSYEVDLLLDTAPYEFERDPRPVGGDTTVGRMSLTHDQHLMVLVLAEAALRQSTPAAVQIPASAAAARRLGWTVKKFEKKLDNVCERLAAHGVRGLKGEQGNLASSRRARLVEYALAARLVTIDDLRLLQQIDGPAATAVGPA